MSYSIPIKLSKDFMMKVHAHPLLADIKGSSVDDPFYISMWAKQPDIVDFSFGGWNGNQFNSSEDIVGFRSAFKNILENNKIDSIHEAPLLYFAAFQYMDLEIQSIVNNEFNYHNDSGQFLLDLYIKGSEEWDKMLKESNYYKVYDPTTKEEFFSKLNPKDCEDLDELYSADAVIYQSYQIGKSKIRIPHTFQCTVFNNSEKNRDPIDIPRPFTFGILDPMIKKLISEHVEMKTDYFEIFNEESHNLKHLKTISKQKKRNTSEDATIIKTGSVIQDYLKAKYPKLPKSAITDFLWEYFALFKAYKIKKELELPANYNELAEFYRNQKITKESIRLKFKGIPITGYF